MIYETVFIIVGLLVLVVVPPFIVYLFKNRGTQQLDAEVLEMMTRDPNKPVNRADGLNDPGFHNSGDTARKAGSNPDENIKTVKQHRKTNPKLHFR